MDQTEYAVACLFLGDPDAPPTPGGILPRQLLQPFQLLDQLRFTLDHSPASAAINGMMIVETKTP
jgi:hypothetical protein